MLDKIPLGVLDFCSRHNANEWYSSDVYHAGDIESNEIPLLAAYSKPDGVRFWEAIKSGRWEVISHAVGRVSKRSRATAVAAKAGNLLLLQHLHEQGFFWHRDTCSEASRFGHLDCLMYAMDNGCFCDSAVYESAAEGGHLACMQFAHLRCVSWHSNVCSRAALFGQLTCLEYAHNNGCPWDSSTTKSAAEGGHINCLRYALEQECPPDVSAANEACKHGRIEFLELLHQYNVAWDASTTEHAALCSDMSCRLYLREHGCEWDDRTPQAAALNGDLCSVRYALENSCPHNELLVRNAAEGDNLDCVRYLIEEQSLYMDEQVFIAMLLKGNFPGVAYLIDNGCPYITAEVVFHRDGDARRWYGTLHKTGDRGFVCCVQYAIQRGWSPSTSFLMFIRSNEYRQYCEIRQFMDEPHDPYTGWILMIWLAVCIAIIVFALSAAPIRDVYFILAVWIGLPLFYCILCCIAPCVLICARKCRTHFEICTGSLPIID